MTRLRSAARKVGIVLLVGFILFCAVMSGTEAAVSTSGTVQVIGAQTYVTFLSNGTFNTTDSLMNVAILTIGGGAGGGGSYYGGGGGAGGLKFNSSITLPPGNYNIAVGIGGAGGANSNNGSNGGNSSVSGIVNAPGGGAGAGSIAGEKQNGLNGANGGGSSGGSGSPIGGNGTDGGYPGGGNPAGSGGGGGGGCGGQGGNASTAYGGHGGLGVNLTSYFPALNNTGLCGGGGGAYGDTTSNRQGVGTYGGGNGSVQGTPANAVSGTPNTGGGGGGTERAGTKTGGNGGSGIIIIKYDTVQTSLNVSLVSPANLTNSTSSSNVLTYSVSGTANLSNCTLYVNSAVNGSTSTGLVNGQYTFTRSFTDGSHAWFVRCVDENLATNSSVRTLNVNTTLAINLESPANGATSNSSSVSFVYNVSSMVNLSNCTLYLNSSANGSASNGLANGQHAFNRTLADASYSWKVGCQDSNAAANTTARTLLVNTSIVLSVTLVSPTDGSTSNVTANNFTYNVWGTANLSNCTLYLNLAANASNTSLPNGQYSFLVTTSNLSTYSWNVGCVDRYNSTNTSAWTLHVDTRIPPNMSILNVSVKNYLGAQITNFTLVIDENLTINVANGSTSSKNYIIDRTVDLAPFCHLVTYRRFGDWNASDSNTNVTTTRVSYTNQQANIESIAVFGYVDGTQSETDAQNVHTTAYLVYDTHTYTNPNPGKYVSNISYYVASEDYCGSYTYARLDDVTATALNGGFYALANVTAGTHALFVNASNYAYGRANVSTTGATTYYQFTIFQERTFNFTIYDETTNALIAENFSIKLISDAYAANYTTTTGHLNVTLLLPSEYQIIYVAVSNTSEYTYPRSYYATIMDGSYENIRLYAVKQSESQYLVPTVTDEDGLLLENAVITMIRGQIEGNSYVGYTVEMDKTDSEGRGLFRLVPNTVYYKFFITHPSGTLTTNYFKVTSGTIKFQLGNGDNPLTAFQNIIGVARTLTYNNASQTFLFNYYDATNTVTQGCLEVRKTDRFGVRSTASNSCADGSTGSVIYTVTDTNSSTYTAYGSLYTSGGKALTEVVEQSFDTSYNIFGLMGILLTTLIYVFFVFLAAPSAEGTIIGGVMALILVGVFGLMAWSWTAFVGIIIIGGVTVYYMNRD